MAAIMLRTLGLRLRLSRYLCRADQRDELARLICCPEAQHTASYQDVPVVWKGSVNVRFEPKANMIPELPDVSNLFLKAGPEGSHRLCVRRGISIP
jgi:hypothetical protein